MTSHCTSFDENKRQPIVEDFFSTYNQFLSDLDALIINIKKIFTRKFYDDLFCSS